MDYYSLLYTIILSTNFKSQYHIILTNKNVHNFVLINILDTFCYVVYIVVHKI